MRSLPLGRPLAVRGSWCGPKSRLTSYRTIESAHHLTTTTAPAGPVPAEKGLPYKWKAFWVIGISLFTMVMDFSITNIALPSIAKDFGLTLRVVSWVSIAGALTITAVLLPMGRLADIAGRKTIQLTGIVLFCAATLLAVFAPNLPVLIAARMIMALGAAMIQAVGTAMVLSVFPQEERGKGLGMITTVVGIGSVAGPIIGGPLVEAFGWRSVYLFLFVPNLIGFFFAWRVLDDALVGTVKRRSGDSYDWPGAGTSAIFFVLAIFTISNPLDLSWTSGVLAAGGVLAAALFVFFVWWELRVKAPMLSLRFFKNSQFTWTTATRFIAFLGGTASWFLMPFFVQDILGYTARTVGFVLFFNAFGLASAAFFSGRLSDRLGSKKFVIAGLVLGMAANAAFITLSTDTPVWLVASILLLNGIGMGTWNAPNTSMTLGAVDRSSYGIVGAFVNLVRNIANVTGTAMITAIVAGVMVSRGVPADLGAIAESGDPAGANAFVAGMRVVYVMQVALLGLALIAAMFSREPERAHAKDAHSARVGKTAPDSVPSPAGTGAR